MSTQEKTIKSDNNHSFISSNDNWKVDYSKAYKIASPNYTIGRLAPISGLVLHGTAGGGTIEWFLNPASKVSAHYVVGQDGKITQMVSEANTAWHAGVVSHNSILANKGNPNSYCIGIEFSLNDIRNRYPNIDTYFHDEISIGRICPGPNFPKTLFRS
ncbi:unnamed protein product [Rotaria sordida]|uniref:N-acetylmuramoyl-L-alanine amidase n=1 Tax=Rotaria sordida TaxID=392033 RepID=A0A813TEJ2_9BILA|nr:unnamed protein product [Rotaria sordida]CAF0729809.1 unnamed protein product [Rotaria sordida]CAF0744144.1 unnamed protein product [Rotaria sordida]CAF0758323.1 unnamed protein product [Rotaria sordida]CAF0762941.1 unnamed protein product [Rotaria sordida]